MSSQGTGLGLVVSAAIAASSLGADIHVPADAPTIQAAVDGAVNGDSVIVADGVYTGPGNRDILIAGKSITVRSASLDPGRCTIDCQGAGRGFILQMGADSRIDGFTITNGVADTKVGGGGLLSEDSSPAIVRCDFVSNQAEIQGGGATLVSGLPRMANCRFVGNTAEAGAGMYLVAVGPPEKGGGSNSMTIVNTIFRSNTAVQAGGMYCLLSNVRMDNCVLYDNVSTGTGFPDPIGGIYNLLSYVILYNSIVRANFPNQIVDGEFASATEVFASNVEGGWNGIGGLVVDIEAMFVNAAAGDLRLAPGSPMIDAGNGFLVPDDLLDLDGDGVVGEEVPIDLAGNPREADDPDTPDDGQGPPPVVDMGAFEFQGASCPADLDDDDAVGTGDLLDLLAQWGTDPGGPPDLDGDGTVGTADLLALLASWGACP